MLLPTQEQKYAHEVLRQAPRTCLLSIDMGGLHDIKDMPRKSGVKLRVGK